MAKVASGQPTRSAQRMLHVLKCFGEDTPELSIAQISRALDLAPSTVRRLLVTLEQEGFVRQDAASGHYRLHTEV
ncbi:MAG: helix-turn-helix domain-containing protein, partial [Alphaproteobacteria bacterium]|nr:helix-turn-helix domain-containing protein [Alphaproteobacteria bacterium]